MFVETNYFCQVKSKHWNTTEISFLFDIFYFDIFGKRCRKPDFTFDPYYLETREIRFSSPRGSFKTCESLFRGSRDPSHFMVIRSDPAFRFLPARLSISPFMRRGNVASMRARNSRLPFDVHRQLRVGIGKRRG